ncbi:MAG: PTS sugar transporter subunit IIA [Lachnospiraceae bacterium]
MVSIIVSGHGKFAEGMVSDVELILGKSEQIRAINFVNGEGIEELRTHMQNALEESESENILMMVDILGGSPFNVATQLCTENTGKNIKVVAGINVLALMQAVLCRDSMDFEELPAVVVTEGRQGMVTIDELLKEKI